MVVVTANVKTISQQKAAMRKLLEHVHDQLAKSSQNEKVIPLGRGTNMDTIANYDTDRITQETVVPLEGSRANPPSRYASIFDRLVFTRNREGRPPFHPLEPGPALLLPQTDHI
ncbi:Hypothetical predicted protein [Olea europaea subsp. europaea]|uniref:Uncharacterized protein n=1 Tax=Olea europaea subsp. europaea TaxID=158383 RepID=A0A8S0Q581_OLEEU|nr:Hypothetical predicted protein [Olea europaea subsp. europaea]